MHINYNYYRIFYYVAKHQNLTQAATALMNSQSNITRAIKSMENELGCTLFVRSNKGVTLTPEGEKLFSYVRVAVEHLQAGEEALSSDRSLQSGSVSIGTSGVALRCFLMPVLKDFQQRYPKIRLRISNHSTPQAVAALRSGSVDLALVTTPVETGRSLKAKNVKTIHSVAVAGCAFSHLADKPITPQDLTKVPIISLGSHTATHNVYTKWFAQHGLPFKPDMEAYTSDQILPLVRNDLGVGFVAKEFLEEENATDLFTLQLTEPLPTRSVCFLKRSDRILNLAAKELERMITAAAVI